MSEPFVPVQRVMYSPEGAKCQVEERQIEGLKAAGFTTEDPKADILEEPKGGEKGEIAEGQAAHDKAVAANIKAQQAAAQAK